MKILFLAIFTIAFFGVPWVLGRLTLGEDESLFVQWLFGCSVTAALGLLIGLFIAGVLAIIQS